MQISTASSGCARGGPLFAQFEQQFSRVMPWTYSIDQVSGESRVVMAARDMNEMRRYETRASDLRPAMHRGDQPPVLIGPMNRRAIGPRRCTFNLGGAEIDACHSPSPSLGWQRNAPTEGHRSPLHSTPERRAERSRNQNRRAAAQLRVEPRVNAAGLWTPAVRQRRWNSACDACIQVSNPDGWSRKRVSERAFIGIHDFLTPSIRKISGNNLGAARDQHGRCRDANLGANDELGPMAAADRINAPFPSY